MYSATLDSYAGYSATIYFMLYMLIINVLLTDLVVGVIMSYYGVFTEMKIERLRSNEFMYQKMEMSTVLRIEHAVKEWQKKLYKDVRRKSQATPELSTRSIQKEQPAEEEESIEELEQAAKFEGGQDVEEGNVQAVEEVSDSKFDQPAAEEPVTEQQEQLVA